MSGDELTINVTAFKAQSLRLLDDLDAGRLTCIRVSRRGKPIAIISPANAKPVRFEDVYGSMRERTRIAPGVDLTKPLIDWDWEAEMVQNWDEQTKMS